LLCFQDLSEQVSTLEHSLTAAAAEHSAQLSALGHSHNDAIRGAVANAAENLASTRSHLFTEREEMLSKREVVLQKNRQYYQDLARSREEAWERLKADYEARILGLEEELNTLRRTSNLQALSASSMDCIRSQSKAMKATYEAKVADLEEKLARQRNEDGQHQLGAQQVYQPPTPPPRPSAKRKKVAFNLDPTRSAAAGDWNAGFNSGSSSRSALNSSGSAKRSGTEFTNISTIFLSFFYLFSKSLLNCF
jgi:polyhydroxyalkanoate synthesis regulator phasin